MFNLELQGHEEAEVEKSEDIQYKPQVKVKSLWSYKTVRRVRLKKDKVSRKPLRVGETSIVLGRRLRTRSLPRSGSWREPGSLQTDH